jgi:putative toxin-antitoxin system antitoxin component (TIGR02293 family)
MALTTSTHRSAARRRAPRRAPAAKRAGTRPTQATLTDLLSIREAIQAIEVVQRGIPAAVVDEATARFGVTKERLIKVLHTSKPTLMRLTRAKRPLDPLTSAALKDAVQVLEKLREAMGGDTAAMTEWLNNHVPALGRRPIELLDTPDGRDLLAATIDRARFGVFG